MHQMSAALGRVQLKYYDERSAEIRRSMNYFWDLLEGVPGIRAHRVDEKTGSNMGGWYAARGLFESSELGGLSVSRFCEAVRAEGADCSPGCNTPLHTHALLQTADIYHQGSPTRIANASRDVRELDQALPHSLAANARTYSIPWFKHYRPDIIREYAEAFKKAALGYKELLPGDTGNPASMGLGNWNFFNSTRGKS
jgi:dTDP-4-amino-4,6-dideoxygalactose transaminase